MPQKTAPKEKIGPPNLTHTLTEAVRAGAALYDLKEKWSILSAQAPKGNERPVPGGAGVVWMKMRHRALLQQDFFEFVSLGAAYAAVAGVCSLVMGPVSLAIAGIVSGTGLYFEIGLKRRYLDELTQEETKVTGKLRDALDKILLIANNKKKIGLFMQPIRSQRKEVEIGTNALTIGDAIVVSEVLKNALEDEEIEVVLAHEVGHIVENDQEKIPLLGLPRIFGIVAFGSSAYQAVQSIMTNADDAGMSIAKSAVSLAAVFAVYALGQKTCRSWEHRADIHSALITKKPSVMVSVLQKLERLEKAERRLSGQGDALAHGDSMLSGYPSLRKRIEVLQNVQL